MASKIRKQIYIDSVQESILKQLSKNMGISEAEIIRQAIDRYSLVFQPPRRDPNAWEEEQKFIQQLQKQSSDRDSAPKTRTWKREDLYDR